MNYINPNISNIKYATTNNREDTKFNCREKNNKTNNSVIDNKNSFMNRSLESVKFIEENNNKNIWYNPMVNTSCPKFNIVNNKFENTHVGINTRGNRKLNVNDNLHLKNLGPEPLGSDFNYLYFNQYIEGRKRVIKEILMDQKCVSGIGNIYANEILFLSKINPLRKVKTLKESELKKIIKFTKNVLKNAIELGGSSIKDFSSSNGKKGSFQQHFNVYGKKGEPCSNTNCKAKIIKSTIANRSSFFCVICQK